MRKFLNLVLVFSLVITMTIPTFAVEVSSETTISESELAFKRACELFPEHADTICNNTDDRSRMLTDPADRIKVFEETREYSENLSITYTEFSDGTAFISTNDFYRTCEFGNPEIVSPYLLHYTCKMTVYSNYDRTKKLVVNGIQYYVDSMSYDNITNRGTIASGSVGHSGHGNNNKDWEDSYGHAYASYYADLPDSRGVTIDAQIRFNVGGDMCYVTLNDEVLTG